jgi:hypothetical protein
MYPAPKSFILVVNPVGLLLGLPSCVLNLLSKKARLGVHDLAPHTFGEFLYFYLSLMDLDIVNNTHTKFNDSIENAFIWLNNNDVDTTKSGYAWLLSRTY